MFEQTLIGCNPYAPPLCCCPPPPPPKAAVPLPGTPCPTRWASSNHLSALDTSSAVRRVRLLWRMNWLQICGLNWENEEFRLSSLLKRNTTHMCQLSGTICCILRQRSGNGWAEVAQSDGLRQKLNGLRSHLDILLFVRLLLFCVRHFCGVPCEKNITLFWRT